MMDPTIYENIKVVIEGVIYDLDLEGSLYVSRRSDQIDLSSLSRSYTIQFKHRSAHESADYKNDDVLKEQLSKEVFAEMRLYAGLKDLATEILELKSEDQPGCRLEIAFMTKVTDVKKAAQLIRETLSEVWGADVSIRQKISYTFMDKSQENHELSPYLNEVTLDFKRKINEEQVEDIERLMEHIMRSLQILNQRLFESES